MAGAFATQLREMERRHRENLAAAESVLPAYLDLSGPLLSYELEQHPELRPNITQLLLGVAEKALERAPGRAYELTSVLVQHTAVGAWQTDGTSLDAYLDGEVWTVHAAALHALGRHAEAWEAIVTAQEIYLATDMDAWHIATAQVVGARIRHDQGERVEALRLIRSAAEEILLHGTREPWVQARMSESSFHWDAGDETAALEVWSAMGREAAQRGDPILLAHLHHRLGIFHLQRGSAEVAVQHFTSAHHAFDEAGLTRETIRARRGLAEAATKQGRFHEAISEYYKVQAMLLAHGDVIDAAVASAETLELLLIAGRHEQVPALAESLVDTFVEAKLPLHAMQAWTFVRARVRAGGVTREEIAGVRRYFEELPLRPNGRYSYPREPR